MYNISGRVTANMAQGRVRQYPPFALGKAPAKGSGPRILVVVAQRLERTICAVRGADSPRFKSWVFWICASGHGVPLV